MSVENILGNLVATIIWVVLGWQVVRSRKKFKEQSAARKAMAEQLALPFSETDSVYEKALRQDAIMAVQVMLERNRRSVATMRMFVLVAFIGMCSTNVLLAVVPNQPDHLVLLWLWAAYLLLLVFNLCYWVKFSVDVVAYESEILAGLKRRIGVKAKEIADPPGQSR